MDGLPDRMLWIWFLLTSAVTFVGGTIAYLQGIEWAHAKLISFLRDRERARARRGGGRGGEPKDSPPGLYLKLDRLAWWFHFLVFLSSAAMVFSLGIGAGSNRPATVKDIAAVGISVISATMALTWRSVRPLAETHLQRDREDLSLEMLRLISRRLDDPRGETPPVG
jgi:hypothetical protein